MARVLALACVASSVGLLAVTSARLRGLFFDTALLAAGALAISLPLGVLSGLVIAKVDLPGRRALAWLTAGMLFVPLYVQAAAWNALFGTGGAVVRWWAGDGYADPWLAGWRGAIWVHGMAGVPWAALAVAASLAMVERKLEEEALLDAAPWRVLVRVSLRRSVGGVLVAAVWLSIVAATEISVTDLFQVRTFAEEVYTQAALGPLLGAQDDASSPEFGFSGAAAGPGAMITTPSFATNFLPSELAIGIAALVLLVLAGLCVAAPRLAPAAAIVADAGWKWRPRRGRVALAAGVWLVVAAIVILPLAGLAGKAGVVVEQHGDRYERTWSAAKVATLVARSPWENRREWGWSLAIGAMAAGGATMLGIAGGWLVRVRVRGGAAPPVATAIAVLLAIPGPLLGAWVIALLNQPPQSILAPLTILYDRTLAAPVLVQSIRALPLAILWMWSQLASVPSDLLDAARSEGASRWTQLVRVAMPLRRAGLLAGAGAALVVAVGELSATLLVLPPGVTTVPVRVFQLLHYGVDDQVAALCLSIFAAIGVTVTITAAWRRWAAGRAERVPVSEGR